MSENTEEITAEAINELVDTPVKKRGRPRKIKEPKLPKKNGRPLKYPEGSRDHRRQTVKIPKTEYKLYLEMKNRYGDLLEIEKKYNELNHLEL